MINFAQFGVTTIRTMPSSSRTPHTSLSRWAPAAMAASATSGLVVSMLMGRYGSAARTAVMAGTTRAISSGWASRAMGIWLLILSSTFSGTASTISVLT